MKISYFLFPVLILVGLVSCDKTDCPYDDKRLCDQAYRDSLADIADDTSTTLTPDTGIVSGNLVLFPDSVFSAATNTAFLEYFTGFRCTNCPPASATAKNLKAQHEERMVLVFVHATQQFAAPIASPPEPFSTDFRTEHGEQLMVNALIPSLPQGTVNRRDFGTGLPISAGDWSGHIDEVLNEEAKAFLRVRKAELTEDQTKIKVQIATRPLNELESGNYNVSLGVIENEIIEAQKDGSETVFPYTHSYVFRGNQNGLFGELAFDGSENLAADESLLFEYEVDIQPEWNPEHLKIIATIIHEESGQVIQAAEGAVIP